MGGEIGFGECKFCLGHHEFLDSVGGQIGAGIANLVCNIPFFGS